MKTKNLIIPLISLMIIALCLLFSSCASLDTDVSGVDSLLRNETNLSKKDNLVKTPIDPYNDNGEYLLVASDFNDIDSNIYTFKFNNGKIKNLDEISQLNGNIINYKTLRINDKLFWQFDVANHQGNGNSYFYSVENRKIMFEVSDTVDWYFEGTNGTELLKNNGFDTSNLKYDNKLKTYHYSIVYSEKNLASYSEDINNDGYDDLVFYGSKLLVKSSSEFDYKDVIPTQIVPVKRTFCFDKEKGVFEEDTQKNNQFVKSSVGAENSSTKKTTSTEEKVSSKNVATQSRKITTSTKSEYLTKLYSNNKTSSDNDKMQLLNNRLEFDLPIPNKIIGFYNDDECLYAVLEYSEKQFDTLKNKKWLGKSFDCYTKRNEQDYKGLDFFDPIYKPLNKQSWWGISVQNKNVVASFSKSFDLCYSQKHNSKSVITAPNAINTAIYFEKTNTDTYKAYCALESFEIYNMKIDTTFKNCVFGN